MKGQKVVRSVTAIATLGAIVLVGISGKAIGQSEQEIEILSYFCGTSFDEAQEPITFVETSQGEYPVIRWLSRYFVRSEGTPERRCTEVSQRLQTFFENGELVDFVADTIDDRPVVCISDSPGGSCSEVLLTLEEGEDPEQISKHFRNIVLPDAFLGNNEQLPDFPPILDGDPRDYPPPFFDLPRRGGSR